MRLENFYVTIALLASIANCLPQPIKALRDENDGNSVLAQSSPPRSTEPPRPHSTEPPRPPQSTQPRPPQSTPRPPQSTPRPPQSTEPRPPHSTEPRPPQSTPRPPQSTEPPRPPHSTEPPRPPQSTPRPPQSTEPRPPHSTEPPRPPQSTPRPPQSTEPRPPHSTEPPRPPQSTPRPPYSTEPPRPPHSTEPPRPPQSTGYPSPPRSTWRPRPPQSTQRPRPPKTTITVRPPPPPRPTYTSTVVIYPSGPSWVQPTYTTTYVYGWSPTPTYSWPAPSTTTSYVYWWSPTPSYSWPAPSGSTTTVYVSGTPSPSSTPSPGQVANPWSYACPVPLNIVITDFQWSSTNGVNLSVSYDNGNFACSSSTASSDGYYDIFCDDDGLIRVQTDGQTWLWVSEWFYCPEIPVSGVDMPILETASNSTNFYAALGCETTDDSSRLCFLINPSYTIPVQSIDAPTGAIIGFEPLDINGNYLPNCPVVQNVEPVVYNTASCTLTDGASPTPTDVVIIVTTIIADATATAV